MSERLYVPLEPFRPGSGGSIFSHATEEIAVPRALRGSVQALVAYSERIADGHQVRERVVPDGTVRLIFHFGAPAALAPGASGDPVQVVGAFARPAVVILRGRMEGLTVLLRPGAVRRLLGVPASEISHRVLHLDDLWRGAGANLLDQLASQRNHQDRVRLIERTLLARLGSQVPTSCPIDRAIQMMEVGGGNTNGGGRTNGAAIAKTMGVGERRLQQLFQESVGLTPRTYGRLLRLRGCLRWLQGKSSVDWARTATELGFYDQAHLTNEFRALTGLTPAAYLRRSIAGSSKTSGNARPRPGA